MKSLALYALVALVLIGLGAALGGWLGHTLGYADGLAVQAKALKTARDDAADKGRQLQTTRDGLTRLKAKLQGQIDARKRLAEQAQRAIAQRETRIAALTQKRHQLMEEIRHDQDSQTLAHVPVPPVVADSLWPGADDHTP